MNNNVLLGIGGLIGLLVVGAVGWYLASPLFIDNMVDEAFPFEAPSASEIDAMSETERQQLEQELMDAMPSEKEVAQLSPEQQAEVEQKVQDAAGVVMMEKEIADDMMPEDWQIAGQGNFQNAGRSYEGSGLATIYELGDERVLRFEDFSVTNGPDLHVVLSADPAPVSSGAYIDLGPLKGNVGNQNYTIPADVDLENVNSVVIYCVPFRVVFAIATLN